MIDDPRAIDVVTGADIDTASTRSRIHAARDAGIARRERAHPLNPPAFSSPRRGADEYPDTRCD